MSVPLDGTGSEDQLGAAERRPSTPARRQLRLSPIRAFMHRNARSHGGGRCVSICPAGIERCDAAGSIALDLEDDQLLNVLAAAARARFAPPDSQDGRSGYKTDDVPFEVVAEGPGRALPHINRPVRVWRDAA
jgi:hypothetical protein